MAVMETREFLAIGTFQALTLDDASHTIAAGATRVLTLPDANGNLQVMRRVLIECLNAPRFLDGGTLVTELQVAFNRTGTADQNYDKEVLPGAPLASNTRGITRIWIHNPTTVAAILSGAGKNVTVVASTD